MPQTAPMSEAMFYILLSLTRPTHGYGMMQSIAAISHGRIHMGPGTLYGVLTRLVKDGLITLCEEEGRKKTYALTDAGRAALLAEYERICQMAKDFSAWEGTP